MKKFFKIILPLIAGIVLVFGVAGCAGANQSQSQIDDLQNLLEEMNDKLDKMEEQTEQLGNALAEANARLENMEEKTDHLENVLAERAQEDDKTTSGFYTLRQVYNNGWLTQANLQTIANYYNNHIAYPESLSEDVAKSIKKSWAEKLNSENADSATDLTEDDIVINNYYGTYYGCAVVIVDRKDACYITQYVPLDVEISGVIFHFQLYAPQVVVCKL